MRFETTAGKWIMGLLLALGLAVVGFMAQESYAASSSSAFFCSVGEEDCGCFGESCQPNWPSGKDCSGGSKDCAA